MQTFESILGQNRTADLCLAEDLSYSCLDLGQNLDFFFDFLISCSFTVLSFQSSSVSSVLLCSLFSFTALQVY